MVWFYCDDCGDTIKKPKLANHFRSCHGHTFTCVDCSRSFDRSSASSHNTCVSEHEKYALGATKPGGYASQGFFKDGQQPAAAAAAADTSSEEVVGMQFLAQRPPWKCSCCNVSCTSKETLLGHAAGVKHKRRARAALGLTGQQQQQQQQQNGAAAAAAAAAADDKQAEGAAAAAAAADDDDKAAEAAGEQPSSKKQKKDKKDKQDKKRKQSEAEDEQQAAAKAVGGDVENPKDKKQKKKDKKDKKGKEDSTEKQQQQQLDIAPLLKVATKKLKKKGKLGLKKLEVLLKENANGNFSPDVVQAVKQQLLAHAEVKLKGNKTLLWEGGSE